MQAKSGRKEAVHIRKVVSYFILSFFFPFQEVAGLSCTYSSCDQPIQILREELQEKIISSKSYSLKSHSWVGLKLQNSGLIQKRYLKPLARRLSSDWRANKPPSYWFYVLCIMTDEPASHWFSVRVYTTSDPITIWLKDYSQKCIICNGSCHKWFALNDLLTIRMKAWLS